MKPSSALTMRQLSPLGFPNANIGNSSAGRITSTVGDNRQMQFALKVDF